MARRPINHPRVGNLRSFVAVHLQNTAVTDGQGGFNREDLGALKFAAWAEILERATTERFNRGGLQTEYTHVITMRDSQNRQVLVGEVIINDYVGSSGTIEQNFRVQGISRVQQRGVWIKILAQELSDGSNC